ncbi:MAG TPA: TIGR03560 family F420-dependent LLM class oxidoreductase [Solirubrobacteraceae bacterium]|jgi:F420-dependent oxidoreductase-like protein|nr:TIGR03560 family F420-dependent LLM class oxidoreductase [Solirubrobacteraceae bacterium]
MDLCLMIEGQEGVTWPQWLALAEACEEHAIPALFRSDHYLNLDGSHPERGSLDAWATISALAALTSTVRLGTLVSPATFRHPSLLAKLAVTADHVSGGRIELGLGAGWHEREHEAYGFSFPEPRARMDILEEQLAVIHGTWTQDRFSFAGDHYRLQDLHAEPRPIQRPHPPLIMGGNARPRSAALAARYADEYNTPFPTLVEVQERHGRISAACAAAGRGSMPFSIMTGFVVGTDAADLSVRLRRLSALRGEDAEAFAAGPPAGWVVGTLDEAAQQLIALRDAGVSRVMCQHLLHDDLEAVALLGMLATRVA